LQDIVASLRSAVVGHRRWHRRLAGEQGSAVVEFALVTILLVLLLFAVLQITALLYVRSIVSSAAADGARYAANAGVDPAAGGDRANELISRSTGGGLAHAVQCSGEPGRDPVSGLVTARVRCHGQIRSILLPIAALVTIDGLGESLKEGQ
jgi:Flp pilus assembly protein TadG